MNKWLNVPNTLSILRIITIPAIVYLIMYTNSSNFPVLVTVYVFSICLDFFDGYLARKLCQETELGKILDPIADKLMVFSLVLVLVARTDFPIWLGVVIVARDMVILTASAVIYRGKHVIASSLLVGKVTFAQLSLLMFIYIIDMSVYIDLELLKKFLTPLCFSFIGWSFFEYYKIYIRNKNET